MISHKCLVINVRNYRDVGMGHRTPHERKDC